MQFIHVQLAFEKQKLSLSLQTHEDTQQVLLHNPVDDSSELANQAELFASIHLRPYFDKLPVQSCQVTIAPDVPDCIRDACVGEVIKLTKTNEYLTKHDQLLKESRKVSGSHSVLCVYSAETPTQALAACGALGQEKALCLAYLPNVKVNHEQAKQLKLFTQDLDQWIQWYAGLGVQALVCGADFVREFERFGVVLSSVVAALGQALVIVDQSYGLGHTMAHYEKRATDSRSIVRYQSDEKSLIWGGWLGLANTRLGPLTSISSGVGARELANVFRDENWPSLALKAQSLSQTPPVASDDGLGLVVCEDLYLRRLVAWLPQAYYVKRLLDEHCEGVASKLVLPELWATVMRRLIVSSEETTDYDVVVLVRRLELITDAVHSLCLVEFLQEIEGKANVKLYGHGNWGRLFPHMWSDEYDALCWRDAAKANPGFALLNTQPVFHPCLSDRCLEAVASGRPNAFFSMYHQLVEPRMDLNDDDPLRWLAQHNVMNADTCCVHLLSMESSRDAMVAKRQAVLDQVNAHNSAVYDAIHKGQWQTPKTVLEQSIDTQLGLWHKSTVEFYEEHAELFNESLMVLNPSLEMGITNELKEGAPAYLKLVLDAIDEQVVRKVASHARTAS